MKVYGNNARLFVFTLLLSICLITSAISFVPAVEAKGVPESMKVLVIYSNESGEISENQRLLDMLIGHFTTNIHFVSSLKVSSNDTQGVTHLFYYGEQSETLPITIKEIFDDFIGTKMAIGHNVEQLGDSYSFVRTKRAVTINEISMDKTTLPTVQDRLIKHIILEQGVTMHVSAHNGVYEYPLLIQQNENYYYGAFKLDSLFSTFFAEKLHTFFKIEHEELHHAYLRLEDIHPLTDPNELKKIGDILYEKNIPYILSVIPIYVNSETGKEIQFKDSPRLVEVLQDLQDKGGSVILHGFTHQYRGDETGEGFEFWDVENNMPISGPADVSIEPLNPDNFSTKEEYENERLKRVEFETDYVQTKVEKGIEELVSYGLYPVAFEAPHYTMSQNAYHIVGDYFSTYIGQLQLSDENWQIMQPAPYETSPSFLNGMKLLPETVGFVDPENPHVLVDIDRAIERQLVVRDGVVAGFYHSYLGVERFKEFLALLESTPNIQWIDLKSYRSVTAIDNVSIEVNEESGTLVHIDYLKAFRDTPQLVDRLIQKITNNVLWFIVFIAGGMVCIFFFTAAVFSLRNSSQKGELR